MNQPKENETTEKPESMLSRARENLLEVRLTGLGLLEKMNSQSKNYWDNIKSKSEAKLQDQTSETSSEEESQQQENAAVKAFATLERTVKQVRAYGVASYEEANEASQKLSDWVTKAFNEAGTEVEKNEDSAISRIGRNLERLNLTLNQLAKDIRESTESVLDEAKLEGKDVDYEMRKALFGRQENLESRLQAFWAALGLVNKQEMEEVNRKLVLLAESVESQLDEESKTLVYLNRRQKDRRKKQVPVEFDKRLRFRREEDRKLAS